MMANSEPSNQAADASVSGASKSGLRLVLLISALLAITVLFGGGGVRYGLQNLVIQLTALAILISHRSDFFGFWRNSPLSLRILTMLSLLLPVLYLIPLPPSIWTALPGRDLMAQSRELVGVTGWSSASAAPARTLVALSGLITPLVILTVGWSIPRRDLMTVGWVVVGLGVVCFLLGALQVLSGGTFGLIYSERDGSQILWGTFANRNSTGLFLVAALTFAALLPLPLARPHPAALSVRLGLCAILSLGIVLTQSRTALALAALPVALGLVRTFADSRARSRSERDVKGKGNQAMLAIAGVIGLGAVAVAATLTLAPGRVATTLERFEAAGDARQYIWDDAGYSVERFWPLGAGMGTFDEVSQIDEALENLTPRKAGRAHNDYIELAIEAGVPGLTLAALWLTLVGWLSWRAGASPFRWAGWACTGILLAIALQSITDYPLRNQTMLAIGAFALLMVARLATPPKRETQI